MDQSDKEKKKYWQGRMSEKIKQAMRQIDWLYDEMTDTAAHAGIEPQPVKMALAIISEGFRQLYSAVNEVIPNTPEGVPDLSKVHEQKKEGKTTE